MEYLRGQTTKFFNMFIHFDVTIIYEINYQIKLLNAEFVIMGRWSQLHVLLCPLWSPSQFPYVYLSSEVHFHCLCHAQNVSLMSPNVNILHFFCHTGIQFILYPIPLRCRTRWNLLMLVLPFEMIFIDSGMDEILQVKFTISRTITNVTFIVTNCFIQKTCFSSK